MPFRKSNIHFFSFSSILLKNWEIIKCISIISIIKEREKRKRSWTNKGSADLRVFYVSLFPFCDLDFFQSVFYLNSIPTEINKLYLKWLPLIWFNYILYCAFYFLKQNFFPCARFIKLPLSIACVFIIALLSLLREFLSSNDRLFINKSWIY